MTDPSDPLPLAERPGIPPTLAYLRGAYPAEGWRGHPSYGQLADFWLHIHRTLCGEAAAVEEALAGHDTASGDPMRFQQRWVPRLNQFLQHLSAHHQIEDHAYFPKFRLLDARMPAAFDLLERDHAAIERQLHETVTGARTLLAALAGGGDAAARPLDAHRGQMAALTRLLARHLADEEEIVIPALLEHGERAVA